MNPQIALRLCCSGEHGSFEPNKEMQWRSLFCATQQLRGAVCRLRENEVILRRTQALHQQRGSPAALLPEDESDRFWRYSCDVWHQRCSPVTAPRRLSRDSLQRLSKSSAFHGATEKYKLIKAVAILDGCFSYLLDCTVLIHQVFVASVWELRSQLFHSTWVEFIIEHLDGSSWIFTTLSESWQITINLGNGIFFMLVKGSLTNVTVTDNNNNYNNNLPF